MRRRITMSKTLSFIEALQEMEKGKYFTQNGEDNAYLAYRVYGAILMLQLTLNIG